MFKNLMISLSLLALVPACGTPPSEEPATAETTSPLLLANTSDVWPTHAINVCFDNPSATTATRRDWARKAIEGSWQRYSNLSFQGWGTCSAGQAGIHITVSTQTNTNNVVTNGAMDVGYNTVNSITAGVKLNLNLSGLATCDMNDTNRQACIQNMIMHEFGHALGFRHSEADSTVTPPGDCSDPDKVPQDPNTTGRRYGSYTSQSIMSSCWATPTSSCWNTASCPTHLFPVDIAGVQRLYGRHANSLVTPTGECLSWTTSSEPALRDCVSSATGVFRNWPNSNFYTFITSGGTSFSVGLTLPNGQTANGTVLGKLTPLVTSDPNEKWTLSGVQIRGYGGLCIDLQGGNTTNGTPIQTWDCGALGGGNQKWDIDTSNRIHFSGTNKCITYTTTMNNGERVFIQDCGAANQVFSFDNHDGSIRFTFGGFTKCMDVQDVPDASFITGNGSPHNGAPIQTYVCLNPGMNQRWNVDGPIHFGSTAKCINNRNGSDAAGNVAEIFDCASATDPEWDYYF